MFSIEGIDTAQGVARFLGKTERYKQVLGKFAEQLERPMPELGGADTMAYAHTIKGTAGNLGVTEVYEAAAALERSIKMNTGESAALYERLDRLRILFAQRIRLALPDTDKAAAKVCGSDVEGAALLAVLEKGLRSREPAAAEGILVRLEAKAWTRIPEREIIKLGGLIRGYDFDGALKAIEGLKYEV